MSAERQGHPSAVDTVVGAAPTAQAIQGQEAATVFSMRFDTGTGIVRPILTDDAPPLRTVSAIADLDDPDLHQDLADLGATLADFRSRVGFGRAISAPQIGIEKRLIMMDLGSGMRPAINPQITWTSEERQLVWDDCLSVPDLLVRVERAASVSLEFTDQQHKRVRWERLPSDLAELFQHEVDHLDGVLMTDRALADSDRAPMSKRATLIDNEKGAASPEPSDALDSGDDRFAPTGDR